MTTSSTPAPDPDRPPPGAETPLPGADDLALVADCASVLAHDYGYLRSVREHKPVDAAGDPVPFYTWPAIDYLRQIDFRERRVFEYGSGFSTLFFAARARSVASVDHNEEWRDRVLEMAPDNVHVDHREGLEGGSYADSIQSHDGRFDVIVIDGIHRLRCAHQALEKLTADGLIIVDNSEWCPRTNRRLREAGLLQVDFVGFGPIRPHAWVTSLFFQRAFEPRPPHGRQPAGLPATSGHLDGDVFSDSDVPVHGRTFVIKAQDDVSLRFRLCRIFDTDEQAALEVRGAHEATHAAGGEAGHQVVRLVSRARLDDTATDGWSIPVDEAALAEVASDRVRVSVLVRRSEGPQPDFALALAGREDGALIHGWERFRARRRYREYHVEVDTARLREHGAVDVLLHGDVNGRGHELWVDHVAVRPVLTPVEAGLPAPLDADLAGTPTLLDHLALRRRLIEAEARIARLEARLHENLGEHRALDVRHQKLRRKQERLKRRVAGRTRWLGRDPRRSGDS